MLDDPAREKIANQLHEAIDRLRTDLVCVEMWASALDVFAHPVPDYDPSAEGLGRHLMPSQRKRPGTGAGVPKQTGS